MSFPILLSHIRELIVDPTVLQANVVDESPVAAKASPFDSTNYWNVTATGREGEEFLTKNMPLISGFKVGFKGDRWSYINGGEAKYTYFDEDNERIFHIDYYRGIFLIPSGAIPVPSGGRIKLTYSYWEDQEYRFSDLELKSWIIQGDSYLRKKLTLPYELTGVGETLDLSPFPSGIWSSLLALSTSYFIRARLGEESIQNAIYIKTGNTVLDTTRSLAHRGRSLQQVKDDLDSICTSIKLKDLASMGIKLDIYSTYDPSYNETYMEYNKTGAWDWVK